jgi:hypothetical protein
MAWTTVFTKTLNDIVITVCKSFINHEAEYTFRFEEQKKDAKGSYLSPNLSANRAFASTIEDLFFEATRAIASDKDKDAAAEADRVKALSAKPGAQLVIKSKEKGAPRANGKTARKKAKLEAARKQMANA